MRSEDGKFDISLDTKEQLIKIGTSKDLGFCKGRKKVFLFLVQRFAEIGDEFHFMLFQFFADYTDNYEIDKFM